MVDSTYIYTVGGYLALAGAGYAVYHVSTQKAKKKGASTTSKPSRVAQPEPRKEEKKKKQRKDNYVPDSNVSKDAEVTTPLSTNVDNSRDDVDNREFAKQLAKAKQGHSFAANNESGKQKDKSVKQSRANNVTKPAQEKPAAPAVSPVADVETVNDEPATPSPNVQSEDSTGVADMLEPTSSGPSVLRLTDTTPKNQQQKAAKPMQPVETKKQRQNRKKAEAAKVAREEAEGERKTLEEKQRRQARVAEGRAAKDGSQFTNAAVKKSAWNEGAPNGVTQNETNGFNQLLDTGDNVVTHKSVAPTAPVKPVPSIVPALPSEEEQMEVLKDDTDDWNTVKTKKTSKKPASVESDNEPQVQSRPAAQAPKQATVSFAPTKPAAPKSFGSFSALTNKDDTAEDEVEEWDV